MTTTNALVSLFAGRRMCIGESLVKSEVFLAVTQLVFLYHMTSKETPPPIDGVEGVFRRVPDYEVIFTKRM